MPGEPLHFRIVSAQSSLDVRATATLKSVTSTGKKLSGDLYVNLDDVEATARGRIEFPMRDMQFGNRLQTWSMQRHINTQRWPQATFDVLSVKVHTQEPWQLSVHGRLDYHGTSTEVTAEARGTLQEHQLDATASFSLALSDIGIAPPEFLFLKVKNTVFVNVHLIAVPG